MKRTALFLLTMTIESGLFAQEINDIKINAHDSAPRPYRNRLSFFD